MLRVPVFSTGMMPRLASRYAPGVSTPKKCAPASGTEHVAGNGSGRPLGFLILVTPSIILLQHESSCYILQCLRGRCFYFGNTELSNGQKPAGRHTDPSRQGFAGQAQAAGR